jgi:hypothetical protein
MKPAMSVSIISCVLLTLLAACSPTQTTGNGSEITNGIVVSASGPIDSAMVIAFPAAYIPCAQNEVMPETTFTDARGAFRMSIADTKWNLLVYDRTRHLGAFAERRKGYPAMGVIELDSLGAVAGTAASNMLTISETAYIGMAGSPFYTKLVKDSSFIITRVPPHFYQISLWMFSGSPMTGDLPILVKDNVVTGAAVISGATTTIIVNN